VSLQLRADPQLYRYEYGPHANLTRATDSLGRETVYEYDTNDIDLLRVKQKNGTNYDLLWSATYNPQHLPLTVTDAAGQAWTYSYNAQGQLVTKTTPPRTGITENRVTTYSYDTNGYLQDATGPAAGWTTSLTYDGYGRVRTMTDVDGHTVTYDYDTLDRPTRFTYPDSTYEETVYNRLDAEKQRDRLGRWTHTFHDALRRAVASRDPMGRTTALQWESASSGGCGEGSCDGGADKLIDPNGNAKSWEKDLQGRVTREIRVDGSAIEVTYENTTSRVKQLKDPKNQLRAYEYFLDNRLKQITYTNAVQPTANVSLTYEPIFGWAQSMTDGTGTTTFAYHPIAVPPQLGAGRLTSIDGPLSGDTDKITLSYDELGRVVRQEINGAANVRTQGFDSLYRLTNETNALGTFAYGYDGVTSRPKTISYPATGQATTFDYLDNLGDHRLKEIHHQRSGGVTLSKFNYTTSAVGLITSWTQQADAAAATAYDYTYDPTDQLTAAVLKTTGATPSILKTYGYGYDKAGNRTAEAIDSTLITTAYSVANRLQSQQAGGALHFAGTVSEAATVTVSGQPAPMDAANRFAGTANVSSGANTVAVTATDPSGNARTNTYQVSVGGSAGSFTHDANGNLIADGSRTYEWDAEDRLTAVVQGTRRSDFSFDGAGRRVRIVEKDGVTVLSDQRYLWCGLAICDERDAAGTTVTRRFFAQGMQEGSDAYFYARDHLGSIRELTDITGALRARYDYDPFGRQTKVSGDKDAPFGFTGHFVHSPSGLLLAPYRPYSPALGRWLTEDPMGLAGGMNLYAYVFNGPTNAADPTGQNAVVVLAAVALVAAIVATAAVMTAWYGTKAVAETVSEMTTPQAPPPPLPPSVPTTTPPGPPPSGPSGGSGGSSTATSGGGGGGGPTATTAPPPGNIIPFPPGPQGRLARCYRIECGQFTCKYKCQSTTGRTWFQTRPNSSAKPCPRWYFILEGML
jgi:RHS repeat-associated protein